MGRTLSLFLCWFVASLNSRGPAPLSGDNSSIKIKYFTITKINFKFSIEINFTRIKIKQQESSFFFFLISHLLD